MRRSRDSLRITISRRVRSLIFAAGFLILTASCAATAPATTATSSTGAPQAATADPVAVVRADLAPTGKLRVAVNYGNTANATLDAATGQLSGTAVDLAGDLAAGLGVPLVFVPYPGAPAVIAGFRAGAWDLYFSDGVPQGFPDLMDDAPPHLLVDNIYVVAAGSPFRSVAEVDQPGVRIAVATGNNPDKYLTSERPLKSAQLVRVATNEEARQLLYDGKVDALAGGRAAVIAGFRALDPVLFVAQLAVALPKGHSAGLAYVASVLETAKSSGRLAASIARSGLAGVRPAPAPVR